MKITPLLEWGCGVASVFREIKTPLLSFPLIQYITIMQIRLGKGTERRERCLPWEIRSFSFCRGGGVVSSFSPSSLLPLLGTAEREKVKNILFICTLRAPLILPHIRGSIIHIPGCYFGATFHSPREKLDCCCCVGGDGSGNENTPRRLFPPPKMGAKSVFLPLSSPFTQVSARDEFLPFHRIWIAFAVYVEGDNF